VRSKSKEKVERKEVIAQGYRTDRCSPFPFFPQGRPLPLSCRWIQDAFNCPYPSWRHPASQFELMLFSF
jgi:hypothetical protein